MICQGKKVKLFVGDQEIIGSESFTINTEEIECSQCTYYNEDEHGNLDCWPIAICVNKSEFTKDLQREDTLKRYNQVYSEHDKPGVIAEESNDGEWVKYEDFEKYIAPHERAAYPNESTCGRCNRPWSCVLSHSTIYDKNTSCFPLCKSCWCKLGTPEAREPYYRQLWEEWEATGLNTLLWETLKEALYKEI